MRAKHVLMMTAGSFVVYLGSACGTAQVEQAIGEADSGAIVDAVRDGVAETLSDAFGDLGAEIAADIGVHDARADDAAIAGKPPTVSGSRLRARWSVQKSGDGAEHRLFVGWYDSTRKEACTAQASSDGTTRCLPVAPKLRPSAISFGDAPVYLDGACSTAVVEGTATVCGVAASTRYMAVPGVSCDGPRIFSVGAKVATPATWYQKTSAGCSALTGSPYGGVAPPDLYAATEVAPNAFVEMTIAEETD